MSDRLLIDERIRPDGKLERSWAERAAGDRIRIADDGGTGGELSIVALDRVMCRYGKPLEDDIVLDGEVLELGDAHKLRRLRFHAIVDAEARDYLVWERPGEPPLAVIATHAAAALRYLALRLAAEGTRGKPSQETEG
ncbi:MAG: hypothetical protein JWO36_3722 [Myxococcales bacterium]|nr:hypothetical protein [Myxococcales bacterium]